MTIFVLCSPYLGRLPSYIKITMVCNNSYIDIYNFIGPEEGQGHLVVMLDKCDHQH